MIAESLKNEARANRVLFFDLPSLLDDSDPAYALRPEARDWLHLRDHFRLGVLAEPARSAPGQDLRQLLEAAGIAQELEPDLVLSTAGLPCTLKDPRAYAVAAALAGIGIEQCLFVSPNPIYRAAAAGAGMRTESPQTAAAPRAVVAPPAALTAPAPALMGLGPAAAPAVLFAGEVDEDTGPTFVLTGRIVTMNSRRDVFPGGQLLISKGKIAAILPAGQPLPEPFRSAPQVATGGTIYPGLMDLHNHFVYNVLPLWKVPKRYSNRSQWPKAKEYTSDISLPVRTLASYALSSRALVRYVETKALIGGTTTGQGIRTRVNGSPSLFHGAMRNAEKTNDPRLPEARTRVPDLFKNQENIEAFRRGLQQSRAYFYHLAEGSDGAARQRFFDLADNDLLLPSLVGIHSLGLAKEDLQELADVEAKVVWSPFSNLLLYGQTLDLRALRDTGVRFSIGCDWSPSGSKNLLEELKVARHVSRKQGNVFSSEELIAAVTTGAAEVVGWQQHLGSLKPGAMADLVVVAGSDGDPYDHLIDAVESDVSLVVVHGVARYGDRNLMQTLHVDPGHPLELISIGGNAKALHLHAPGSGLDDLSFTRARELLLEAMADLHGFRATMESQNAHLMSMGVTVPQPFTLELDNEYEPSAEELQAGDGALSLLADFEKMADSIELDEVEVNTGEYLERLREQQNLDQELVEELISAYA